MFEVSVDRTFAAAHKLRDYHGKCESLHGHNYKVRVSIESEVLDEIGLVVDFVEIKRLIDTAIDKLDHTYLNEIPPFDVLNPSAENIAKLLHDEIAEGLAERERAIPIRVAAVKIWETETSTATYRP